MNLKQVLTFGSTYLAKYISHFGKSRQNHYHLQNLLNTLFDSNASQKHYLFKEVLPQTVADDVNAYQI